MNTAAGRIEIKEFWIQILGLYTIWLLIIYVSLRAIITIVFDRHLRPLKIIHQYLSRKKKAILYYFLSSKL